MLIGEPSRAAMLWSLMGGESRPASELAMLANVSPQTASNHLRLLLDGGFVKAAAMGRNKFYRLGSSAVAAALESLAVAVHAKPANQGIAQHSAPELVFARTCYDHLAGELGVAMLARLRDEDCLKQRSSEYRLTPRGQEFLHQLGVDVAGAQAMRRRFAYPCLDWSQRVPHLGGALGAALLDWLLRSRVVVRREASRAVRLTRNGQQQLGRLFEIRLTRAGAIAH